ncbi:hypothetical protein D9M68_587310 [compost metagenome]
MAAPVSAGHRLRHADPGAQFILGGRVLIARGVRKAAAGGFAALPMELHLDAVVAVGVHRVFRSHHQRGLRAEDGGTRMQPRAMAILRRRTEFGVDADASKGVLVEVRVVLRARAAIKRLAHRAAQVGIEVIAGLMRHRNHDVGGRPALLIVAGQLEALPRRQRTHGARSLIALLADADGGQGIVRQPFALRAVLVGVLPGVVVARQLDGLRPARIGLRGDRTRLSTAIVPAGHAHGIGLPALALAPLLDAVFRFRHVRARETHAGLRARLEGPIVVRDDQRMAVRLVLDPIEQTLFREQAFNEGKVGFAVLDGQTALGVGRPVLHVPAPLRRKRRLALIVPEHALDDVEHRLVLIGEAVAPGAQEGQPRLHGQGVASHAAVGAAEFRRRHMAVPEARLLAVQRRLQAQRHRLPQQRLQRDVGIAGQRRDFQPARAPAQLLVRSQRLRHEAVLAQRRGQVQQAVGLRYACGLQAGKSGGILGGHGGGSGLRSGGSGNRRSCRL